MPTVQETVDELIADARSAATEALNDASDAAALATQAASILASPSTVGNLSIFAEPVPDPAVPNLHAIFEGGEISASIRSIIQSKFNSFISAYYPSASAIATDNWLYDAIVNGGTGIPAAVEDAIWNRARDRADEDLMAYQENAADQFSRLGWYVPPGALVDQIIAAQELRTKKLCEINRDIAIAAAELEQDNIQFAIGAANDLRNNALNAAINYMRTFMDSWPISTDRAAELKEAAKDAYLLNFEYYRMVILIEEFKKSVEEFDLELDLAENKLAVDIINARAERLTEAALSVATTSASIAASSLSGQNTMGTLLVEETTA